MGSRGTDAAPLQLRIVRLAAYLARCGSPAPTGTTAQRSSSRTGCWGSWRPRSTGTRSASRIRPVSPGAVCQPARAHRDGTISGKIAKDVFDAMWAGEMAIDADTIIAKKGLTQISDEARHRADRRRRARRQSGDRRRVPRRQGKGVQLARRQGDGGVEGQGESGAGQCGAEEETRPLTLVLGHRFAVLIERRRPAVSKDAHCVRRAKSNAGAVNRAQVTPNGRWASPLVGVSIIANDPSTSAANVRAFSSPGQEPGVLTKGRRATRRSHALAADRTLQLLVADLVAARRAAAMTQEEVAARMDHQERYLAARKRFAHPPHVGHRREICARGGRRVEISVRTNDSLCWKPSAVR